VPVTPSPPASIRPAPQRAQAPKAARKQARPPAKRSLPRVAPAATSHSSSPDTLLLIGGVALVILVLGDTVFLAFSARFLREAR
jgi:hypothetical protein